MNRIKLFCFPYAGGSAFIFNKWRQYMLSEIELRPIELAGRGTRINDVLYKNVDDLISNVLEMVEEEVSCSKYALMGHSMGSMISYELAQRIRRSSLPDPMHIFFSGHGAPHVKQSDEKKYHLMNDTEFRNSVLELGGTPPEFFENRELLEIFLPVLKNDFKLTEMDRGDNAIHPLDCNVTVFLGKQDDLTAEECDGWKLHTKQHCSIHYFEGGHFFFNSETEQLAKIVNHTLAESISIKSDNLQIV